MQLRLLGPLEVGGEGGVVPLGGPKERALLALLAVRANQVVSEDAMVEALWGDEPPRTAAKTLRSYVSRLRKTLADNAADEIEIETVAGGYRLSLAPGALDVTAVEALAAEADTARQNGDPSWAAVALAQAVRSWRGAPLGEFADEPWAMAEAARLSELRTTLLEEHAEAELACGRHAALVPELEALCATHPLRERLWGQRMIALYRSGRQAEALRVYQQLRATLGDELGLDPGPELQALERSILEHDPALRWAPPDHVPSPLPPRAVGLPTGVVTFVLTDIEDSAARWEEDPEAMAVALARHDQIVSDVIAAAGGQVIKSKGEGDATLSVFRRASEAVAAAAALQRAINAEPWPGRIGLHVRIAVHTGEAHEREGDYYGPTLNRAARLRSLAAGGQILLSEATTALVRDRLPEGNELTDLGRHQLKGLAHDEQVFELHPQGLRVERRTGEPADAGPRTLPPALVPADDAFVGRDKQLVHLTELWDQARSGERRAVLIGGEPGVGKTSLAGQLAMHAHERGGVVLYGRCDEDLGVAYQPFVEAVGDYVLGSNRSELAAQRPQDLAEIARLLPRVAERIGDVPAPFHGEPETERFWLFEAITSVLATASASAPIVLVLDDLHWAPPPTLLMLRHLLRARVPMAMLIVATYRDTELGRRHPLAATLADLRRDPDVERLSLSGLDDAAVRSLIEVTGAAPDSDAVSLAVTARSLRQVTDGNPFFLRELLRHVDEDGVADDGIPEGVKEVVGRRLSGLPDEADDLLTFASVIGRDFSLDLLELVTELPLDRVLGGLERAAGAHLVEEIPSVYGRYTFAHTLVRETLYGELGTARRVRLHARVGEALERLAGDDVTPYLGELARHFYEAARAGDLTKAVDYCRRAGDEANRVLAYEEAVSHYQRALECIELERDPDESLRGELIVALGDAYWRAGERDKARETFNRAVEVGRAIGDAELLGRGALGVGIGRSSPGEGFEVSGTVDDALVGLLEEALDGLPDQDSPLRARLLGRLAVAMYWSDTRETREELIRAATEMAERTGDAAAMLSALSARRYALWGPEDLEDRLATSAQMLELAERSGNREMALDARRDRVIYLFERGDTDQADAELATFLERAQGLGQPLYIWHAAALTTARAIMQGRFDEAEVLAAETLELGNRAQDPGAIGIWGAQMLWLWRERGRLDQLEALIDSILDVAGAMPAAQAGGVWVAAEIGQLERAQEGMDRLAANGFADLPHDVSWTGGMTTLARACVLLGDAARARMLYGHLLPYSGRNVMVWGAFSAGAVDHYLATLAATALDPKGAVPHFERAMASNAAMGAAPLLARTQRHYGAVLLETAVGADDRARGLELLEAAHAAAEKLGMPVLAAEAASLLDRS